MMTRALGKNEKTRVIIELWSLQEANKYDAWLGLWNFLIGKCTGLIKLSWIPLVLFEMPLEREAGMKTTALVFAFKLPKVIPLLKMTFKASQDREKGHPP